MSSEPLSQEMRDLLIRVDVRVEQGFDNINRKLDGMERRADGHEERIRGLEERDTQRSTLVERFKAVETAVSTMQARFQLADGASNVTKPFMERILFPLMVLAIGAAAGALGKDALQHAPHEKPPLERTSGQASRD